MKRWIGLGCGIGLAIAMMGSPVLFAAAPTPPNDATETSSAEPNRPLDVTILPPTIAIATMRGEMETRTVVIRSTSPIRNVQLIPLELNHVDGQSVLPRRAIRPDRISTDLGEPFLSIPITFDLKSSVRSGEFTGNLLVSYQNAEQDHLLTIPITIRIKDRWLVPLMVLVIGVILGTRVSIYRTQGRPRDEILVRIGQLRSQMRADTDIGRAEAFRQDIERHLIDAEVALQSERWDESKAAIAHAESVWVNWRKSRASWLAQSHYHDELVDRILQEPSVAASPYLKALHQRIDDVMTVAPEAAPEQLHQQLNHCGQQMNQFIQTQADLDHLNQLIQELPTLEQYNWRSQVERLNRQLHVTPPDADADHQNLHQTVEGAIAQLEPLVAQQGGATPPMPSPNLMTPAPALQPGSISSRSQRAQLRLQIFAGVSYAIAVILLSGVGYLELYINNPTFGATPWPDYFSLLAWGFGAETTRDSITKVLQDWVPGIGNQR
jgi:hypothetical protein